MRFISAILFAIFASVGTVQAQSDSVFQNYRAYAAFVDKHVMTRDFVPLILKLGGRDEYSPDEMDQNNAKLRSIWRNDFTHSTVFRREDLGGGVRQEGRMYWNGTSYAFFYALLHDRDDGFVVVSFHLNTNSKAVLERF